MAIIVGSSGPFVAYWWLDGPAEPSGAQRCQRRFREVVAGGVGSQLCQILSGGIDHSRPFREREGVNAEYVPVTDYNAALSGFATGDLNLVWFGGLTGVQAQEAAPGSTPIVQRDIDAKVTSVFVAPPDSDVKPIDDVDGLAEIAGHSLTFGSESSTSGRLMPQYFLDKAGVDVDKDLKGQPGFSGSHDATIEQVSAGTYEVGARQRVAVARVLLSRPPLVLADEPVSSLDPELAKQVMAALAELGVGIAVISIGLPFGAVTATVFAETIDEVDPAPYVALRSMGPAVCAR